MPHVKATFKLNPTILRNIRLAKVFFFSFWKKVSSFIAGIHHNLKLTLARSGLVHIWEYSENMAGRTPVFGFTIKTRQEFHIFCGDTENRSELKFVFHIAPISVFMLSGRVVAPETGIKDGPDAEGYSAQKRKNTVYIAVCILLDTPALSAKALSFPLNRNSNGLLLDELVL